MNQLMFGVLVCLHMILYVSAKPFFLNNNGFITSLLASSSASASSASSYQPAFEENPYSENIAIVPPPSHISKPMKLQFQVFNFTRSNEDNIIFPNDTQETTQMPIDTTTETSFLQKKINKIIRKIVTISQIKNVIHNYNTDEEGSGFQYPNEFTTELNENYTVEPRENEVMLDKIRRPTEEYGAPFKLHLQETNDNDGELSEEINTAEEPETKAIPAALGIFVLEMFASLVGLTVGAVNQISYLSSGQHNNTV